MESPLLEMPVCQCVTLNTEFEWSVSVLPSVELSLFTPPAPPPASLSQLIKFV